MEDYEMGWKSQLVIYMYMYMYLYVQRMHKIIINHINLLYVERAEGYYYLFVSMYTCTQSTERRVTIICLCVYV